MTNSGTREDALKPSMPPLKPVPPTGDARSTMREPDSGVSFLQPKRPGHSTLFVTLCLAIWLMNSWMSVTSGLPAFWSGLWVSLLSVPFWAVVGVVCSILMSFILRLAEVSIAMSRWHRFNVGLALGLVLKPLLGIAL